MVHPHPHTGHERLLTEHPAGLEPGHCDVVEPEGQNTEQQQEALTDPGARSDVCDGPHFVYGTVDLADLAEDMFFGVNRSHLVLSLSGDGSAVVAVSSEPSRTASVASWTNEPLMSRTAGTLSAPM
ncbi:Uncharacterised protein [Mycobacteroides abscessus subsp. massiliense]|nr:Uncharacterised protein [Mycobacteroides abscessus subsp. massiliense]